MLKPSAMSEPRCPGCNHPEPLHTMACEYRDPLYPILTDLITKMRDTAAVYPGATGRLLREIAEGAEARLREVQGE